MNMTINRDNLNHPDRLFSANPVIRELASELYLQVKTLPIISPHGHTDPKWFASNQNFTDATELLIKPDHYVFRMLYSQGISLGELGIENKQGTQAETDNRKIWQLFADNYYLFRGTPSKIWLDTTFEQVFSINTPLNGANANVIYDAINEKLATDAFKPRALFERFNIEVLTTTEAATDDLRYHKAIRESGWLGKVITAFRPDQVVDPDFYGFGDKVRLMGEQTKQDVASWQGYLKAIADRRQYFIKFGATSTDHGHPSAVTCDLPVQQCQSLLNKAISGDCSSEEAEQFRGQMLTEMAKMSIEDGLVMQLHVGSYRNHNSKLYNLYGRDKGADLPTQIEYVKGLKPLLDKFGNNPDLHLILFTLDESVYARELAPLAGHYPSLKIGPAWWFHDSPEGIKRYRNQVTETAGFYNTVGFNDDTRAFLSIPARHDLARRVDCNFLAELVAEHKITLSEAYELAVDLAYGLAKKAYKL
nr:glucuronate isomerase [Paraglaciecola marina]